LDKLLRLIPHPETPADWVESIECALEYADDGCLWVRYHAELPLNDLHLPVPAQPARADNLWKTTCFELFARRSGDAGYLEYNFSPSGQWAAYRFDGYRDGMREHAISQPPDIGDDASESHFALEAFVELPADWRGDDIEIGLTAVIEHVDGSISYWALRHPPGRPDFHHRDCFALKLTPPERA
jgi:hypothetical protein